MNTNLIKKCLVELDKESPNLSYLKGILESIVELSVREPVVIPYTLPNINKTIDNSGSGLDTSIPNSYVASTGPIGKLE